MSKSKKKTKWSEFGGDVRKVKITCDCKRQRSNDTERKKYGVSRCDTYSMSHTFGHTLANALYMYVDTAKNKIIRDDFDLIDKHAKAIREFSQADSWDSTSSEVSKQIAYSQKEKAWREAMFWLTENWKGLWW